MMKDKHKTRMKRLARKFCRRHNVYAEFDSSVANLIEHAYVSAYLICLHESRHKLSDFEQEIAKLKSIEQFQWSSNEDIRSQLKRSNEKLTKAKEVIKLLLWDSIKDVERAEQFLKEVDHV